MIVLHLIFIFFSVFTSTSNNQFTLRYFESPTCKEPHIIEDCFDEGECILASRVSHNNAVSYDEDSELVLYMSIHIGDYSLGYEIEEDDEMVVSLGIVSYYIHNKTENEEFHGDCSVMGNVDGQENVVISSCVVVLDNEFVQFRQPVRIYSECSGGVRDIYDPYSSLFIPLVCVGGILITTVTVYLFTAILFSGYYCCRITSCGLRFFDLYHVLEIWNFCPNMFFRKARKLIDDFDEKMFEKDNNVRMKKNRKYGIKFSKKGIIWANYCKIKGFIKSLIFISIVEVDMMYSIWISVMIVCLMKELPNHDSYIFADSFNDIVGVMYLTLLLSVFGFHVIVFFGIWNAFRVINDPFLVSLFYCSYREWIYYRIFMTMVYSLFLALSVFIFGLNIYLTFGEGVYFYYDYSRPFGSLVDSMVSCSSFLIPTIGIFVKIVKIIKHDDVGSIVHVRKIIYIAKNASYTCSKFFFPYIDISVLRIMFQKPTSIATNIIFALSLFEDKCELQCLKHDLSYTHLYHIFEVFQKMTERDVKFLQYVFYVRRIEEPSEIIAEKKKLRDVLMFGDVLGGAWLKECICCFCRKRRNRIVRSSEETL